MSWHPDARKVLYEPAGPYETGFKPRLVWHTTETSSLPKYSGTQPHFTIDPRSGVLWQHQNTNVAAKALRGKSIAGIATNLANAIQVEIIGFASQADQWNDGIYDELSDLARWIENNCGVKPVESVTFEERNHPMSKTSWQDYEGHCGHQHVPGQDHWDPGAMKIAKVLNNRDSGDPFRVLKPILVGPDVKTFQRATNRRARGCNRPDREVLVDGVFGSMTRDNGAWGAYILGIGDSTDEIKSGGISVYVQRLMAYPDGRNDTQLERAEARRKLYCND